MWDLAFFMLDPKNGSFLDREGAELMLEQPVTQDRLKLRRPSSR
jgi:hypothetical protein